MGIILINKILINKKWEKRGANYTPDGLKKITQLQIANQNLVYF